MKPVFALPLSAVIFLAACTPTLTLMSRKTGEMGTGTAENVALGSSGAISISFAEEAYSGSWIAVSDPGSYSFGLINTTGSNGDSAVGTSDFWSYSDSGFGTALLRSNRGNSLRCEFKYSTATYTAVGICQKNGNGEIFDLQAS
jgi:hypothetical protein